MLVESHYFNDGALRASWVFASPNQFGAFLATCLPVAWAVQYWVGWRGCGEGDSGLEATRRRHGLRRRMASIVVLAALELGIWYLLAKSGSRGAVVAALGAAFWWTFSALFGSEKKLFRLGGWLGLRVAVCAVGLLLSSAVGRFSPHFVSQDRSIGNRTVLWSGGAQLMVAAPWTGWGEGDSGAAFLHWTQPFDRPERYKTMVNSFITLGVERGVPTLWVVLTAVGALCLWSLQTEGSLSPGMAGLGRCASCVIVAWAMANAFSSLADDWRLWAIPALAILVVAGSVPQVSRKRERWLFWGLAVLLLGLVPLAVLLAWGKICVSRSGLSLAKVGRAGVLLSNRAADALDLPRWAVIPDVAVLGPNYGQEIRRWALAETNTPWSALVFDPRYLERAARTTQADSWLLCGEAARFADELGPGTRVVFLHPQGMLPRSWRGRGLVLLPEVDESGAREAWLKWAERTGLKSVTVAQVGTDALMRWPYDYRQHLAGVAD